MEQLLLQRINFFDETFKLLTLENFLKDQLLYGFRDIVLLRFHHRRHLHLHRRSHVSSASASLRD